MVIIQSLKQHFKARAIEWGMSGWAFTWGLMILFYPEMFVHPATAPLFTGLLDAFDWLGGYAPFTIGMCLVLVALLRGTALTINGLWRKTPTIRIVTSAISAFFIMHLIVGFSQGPPNTGSITYFWLFIADCYSAKSASEDWLEANRRKPIKLIPQRT